MTRTLFVYWQQLTHRTEDEAKRAEAPVLELDVCFGAACFDNPAISTRHAASITRLPDLGAGLR